MLRVFAPLLLELRLSGRNDFLYGLQNGPRPPKKAPTHTWVVRSNETVWKAISMQVLALCKEKYLIQSSKVKHQP